METVQLSHKEFLKINKNYSKAAKVADLVYVNDQSEGIKRQKKGEGFAYIYDNKPLKDKKELERIKKTGYTTCLDQRMDLPKWQWPYSGHGF